MQLQAPGRQGLLAWVLTDNPNRHFYRRCGGLEASVRSIELAGQSWPLTGYRWSSAPPADTRVFNPDHYLETLGGRVFSQSRNADAWRLTLLALEAALTRSGPKARLLLVVGMQAAGKTTWIEQHRGAGDDNGCLYFDAALPRRVHRAPILALAYRSRRSGFVPRWSRPLHAMRCAARIIKCRGRVSMQLRLHSSRLAGQRGLSRLSK